MPLTAPPGPLWTADAKEPHPFADGVDGPGSQINPIATFCVRREDDGRD